MLRKYGDGEGKPLTRWQALLGPIAIVLIAILILWPIYAIID